MSAILSLQSGDLATCLAEVEGQVRNEPAEAKHRVFLFQLLAVLGQWDRALTQLEVSGDLDASTLAMVQTYREALRCEALRAEVFAGRRTAIVLGQPDPWIAAMSEALRHDASGNPQEAQALREQALEKAPATSGTIATAAAEGARDPQGFDWIADADSRLGPILEAIVNGSYYWIPFQRIHAIEIEAPADLRDVVWLPADFTWSNGGRAVGLIPTRYQGSESCEDGMVRLARKTDWLEARPGAFRGLGQRMLATDADEYPLMDVRSIRLDTLEQGSGDAAADG